MYRFENVSVYFNDKRVLNNVSFNIKTGDVVGLIGKNGSGKTTSLKLMANLLIAEKGNVYYNDRLIKCDDTDMLSETSVFLDPERSLYWRLSAIENLKRMAVLKHLDYKKEKERIDFLLKELQIYENKDEYFIGSEDFNSDKFWLLEEGNCLRKQMESICHLKENSLKPKNLEFSASSISTLIKMVDKTGGITILPELAMQQLSEEQKKKVFHFKKPFPSREISLIYYKPTYKQKMLNEFGSFIKEALSKHLNYNKNPKNFSIIAPQ